MGQGGKQGRTEQSSDRLALKITASHDNSLMGGADSTNHFCLKRAAVKNSKKHKTLARIPVPRCYEPSTAALRKGELLTVSSL